MAGRQAFPAYFQVLWLLVSGRVANRVDSMQPIGLIPCCLYSSIPPLPRSRKIHWVGRFVLANIRTSDKHPKEKKNAPPRTSETNVCLTGGVGQRHTQGTWFMHIPRISFVLDLLVFTRWHTCELSESLLWSAVAFFCGHASKLFKMSNLNW